MSDVNYPNLSSIPAGQWYWMKTKGFTRFMRVPGGLLAESQGFTGAQGTSLCFIPMEYHSIEWFIKDCCDIVD